jgi:hypothetical protein
MKTINAGSFFFWFFSVFFLKWWSPCILRLSLPFSFCFSLLYSPFSGSWRGCWDEEDDELTTALAVLVRFWWRMAVAAGMKKMMSWRWRWQCWCGCDWEWQRFFPCFKTSSSLFSYLSRLLLSLFLSVFFLIFSPPPVSSCSFSFPLYLVFSVFSPLYSALLSVLLSVSLLFSSLRFTFSVFFLLCPVPSPLVFLLSSVVLLPPLPLCFSCFYRPETLCW